MMIKGHIKIKAHLTIGRRYQDHHWYPTNCQWILCPIVCPISIVVASLGTYDPVRWFTSFLGNGVSSLL